MDGILCYFTNVTNVTNSVYIHTGIRHLFFGFDSETVIGDGFTKFANTVSVSLVKQAVSLKPKLEPVSVSTNGRPCLHSY